MSTLRLIALATASSVGCAGGLVTAPPAEPRPDPGGIVGNSAPDFRLEPLAGAAGAVTLRALRGKVVLLDFWGTYCSPCRASFPRLQRLSERYGAEGLQVLAVSEDEAEDETKIVPFAKAHGATFPVAWDRERTIARLYGPRGMPSTFIIDRRGMVRFEHDRFVQGDEVELEREVKELLRE
jgi:peroxiredoxin